MLDRSVAGSRPEVLMALTPLLLLSNNVVKVAREQRQWRGEARMLSTWPRYGCWVPARREEWRQAHRPLSRGLWSVRLHLWSSQAYWRRLGRPSRVLLWTGHPALLSVELWSRGGKWDLVENRSLVFVHQVRCFCGVDAGRAGQL